MSRDYQIHLPVPVDGQTWGPWKFDKENLLVEHVPKQYEIRLAEIDTSARMLDWIFQLNSKPWCSAEDIGNLVQAFDDLLFPQGNLCSGGGDMPFNAKDYFAQMFSQ